MNTRSQYQQWFVNQLQKHYFGKFHACLQTFVGMHSVISYNAPPDLSYQIGKALLKKALCLNLLNLTRPAHFP
jgi:hypothetical protein